MEAFDVYRDIAERTGGEIYIGVVGPVRTGKSTLVKRFLESLVLPNIEDEYERQRTIDEMPRSGAGRTVMTTGPKFGPDEGVAVRLGEGVECRLRLIDSVGYPVEGALGYTEDDGPRMVTTPWFDYDIPFEEAAEVGTLHHRPGGDHRRHHRRDPPRELRGARAAHRLPAQGAGQAVPHHPQLRAPR